VAFPQTRRSVIAALASDDAEERTRAFDTLVAIYWKPLYKYARVAHRRGPSDAEDHTQSFLARAFERNSLAGYDAAKASFRTFLRALFDRHIANEMKAGARLKRGGGETHVDFAAAEAEAAREHDRGGTPEEYFRREWIRSLFEVAVGRLRETSDDADFALFEAYDLDPATPRPSYRELGDRLGMSETTVTNRLASARRRFRQVVLDLLHEATASESEFREELRAVFGAER
jgi:RNA polymerase sigma factor (sigma-70 family)